MPAFNPISMPCGETLAILWTFSNPDGTPVTQSISDIAFTVNQTNTPGTRLFQKTMSGSGGIVATNLSLGQFTITIAVADTTSAAPGYYTYDIKVTFTDGTVSFATIGPFILNDHPNR